MTFVMIIAAAPLLLGILYQRAMRLEKTDYALAYVEGSLLLFCMAGIFAMPAIKFGASFIVYRNITAAAAGILCLAGAVLFLLRRPDAGVKFRLRDSLLTINKEWKWKMILPVAVIFLALCAVFFIYEPAVREDCSAEIILTTVKTNTLFLYHPLTGEELVQGMYPAAKLIAQPLIYSILYDLGQTDIQTFLYRLIPVWVLAVNFLIIWKWTGFLWKEKADKRFLMLFFYGALNLFGDYLFITYSYKLLHMGWTGETLFVVWIIPFLSWLLMDMLFGGSGKNIVMLIICMLASLFMVPWKMALFLIAVAAICFALLYLIRRRKYAGSN